MSQSYPLSEDVNKSNDLCCVCLATWQLHLRDGTVHEHGPRDSPCPGSDKLPLRASQRSVSVSDSPSLAGSSAPLTSKSNSSQVPSHSFRVWSPGDLSFIKHIPTSARAACASHLASLLRSIVPDPASATHWIALFNWAGTVLQPPKREGKRHSLTATIKSRISSLSATAPLNASVDPRHDKRRRAIRDSITPQRRPGFFGAPCVCYQPRLIGNEGAPIQLAQCRFPALAISNAKILIYF